MNRKTLLHTFTVRLLTLSMLSCLTGCAFINSRYGESCNSHAYVQHILADFISSRFNSQAPVRMAVIPFSVPANIAGQSNELPGMGSTLAWKVHAELLNTGVLPIVEVLNREDWPGKKEEFFTGNYGALAQAREADYDLVLVGYLEKINPYNQLVAYSKIIDVDSGITLWYARTNVDSHEKEMLNVADYFGIQDRRPDYVYTAPMVETMARCIARDVISEENVPEV